MEAQEKLEKEKPKGSGIGLVIVSLIIVLLGQLAISTYYILEQYATPNADLSQEGIASALSGNINFILSSQLLLWLGLLSGPLFAFLRGYYTMPNGSKMFAFGFSRKTLLIGIPIGLGLQLITLLLGALLQGAAGQEELSGNAEEITNNLSSLSPVILFFMIAIGAPIVEEIAYRGLVFTAFAKKFGLMTGGIVSSVIFGLSHYQGSSLNGLFVLLIVTTLGGVLAYARHKTGGLLLPILIHIGFNSVSVLALILQDYITLPQ